MILRKNYKVKWIARFHKKKVECWSCRSIEKLERDHVMAIRLGGSDTLSNLQLLCESCHKVKTRSDMGKIVDLRKSIDWSAARDFIRKNILPNIVEFEKVIIENGKNITEINATKYNRLVYYERMFYDMIKSNRPRPHYIDTNYYATKNLLVVR